MKQNSCCSYNHLSMPLGCRLCVQGRKSVILITGICPRKCFYCPLSDQKYQKDVVYANERKVDSIRQLMDEVAVSKSRGVGITGGDPLSVMDRTVKAIKALKRKFGKKFHIHLYTSLVLATEKNLKRLHDAGLDEIRFHPDLDDPKLWERLKLASSAGFKWKKGIEIPAIPGYGKKIESLIAKYHSLIDFLNINELEISDTNAQRLTEKGFVCKNRTSYGIKGSEELALKLTRKFMGLYPGLHVHYCTSALKDGVQLANRLKIRAQSVKKPFDLVDSEGLLIRGAIYAEKGHAKIMRKMTAEHGVPPSLMECDKKRNQVLIAAWVLQQIFREIPYRSAIVKEYPTSDRLLIEVDFLKKFPGNP